MSDVHRRIRFLRDCYRADTRGGGIYDLLSRKLEHCRFIAPEERLLVLVDEATQCDLASCLPIIDRGKKLVVTGDPRQLRHVSFLSRSRQRHLAARHSVADRPDHLPGRHRDLP